MSVAFTKEGDAESVAADLPDRPISPHPNLVTPDGLMALDRALEAARAAYTAARQGADIQSDRTAMARATRELRYYTARRASAQVVEPAADRSTARFGSTVAVEREDGRVQTYRIVGEDEADPAQGLVSYVSPLAVAVLGRGLGEEVVVAGTVLEIVGVR